VDARSLTPEERERLRKALANHGGELQAIEKWMRSKAWYSNDPVPASLTAANNALHAAIGCVLLADRLPPPQPPKESTGGGPESFPPMPPVDRAGLPDAAPKQKQRR
jgi:hypothetical protein